MHIMSFIIFEEIKDQYPLSLNRDRDRLEKYWAIDAFFVKTIFHVVTLPEAHAQ